ncbi:MAG: MFS transporter [Planctomycetaceae bacterium]|jgi:nucleoside transporter|nr:MFS transporter [Planctomycetaceae bacterium]
MSDQKTAFVYPRLCTAYFCEFAIWAAWAGALSGYAEGGLKLLGWQIASLYSAIPLGAVIGPLFVGPIADRYFATQKVMGFLHLLGGAALLLCGHLCQSGQATFGILMALMLLSGICYMPTQGLLNSVVFKNLSKPSLGPYVFVFGTIGWIISSLFIAAFCGGEKTPNFFFVGGGVSIFLAFYCFTLPNTPPKGASEGGSVGDALGLGAFKLFKDPAFALFVFCVFFASVPACGFYFPVQVPYLSQMGYPSPVALTTLNQFSEIFFMAALPFCVARFGLKPVILLGMFAWVGRYILFALPGYAVAPQLDLGFSIAGLLFHGFSYSFLYIAAYMYAERKAPDNLKASVQSMMVFLLLGVGQVAGGYTYGILSEAFPAKTSSAVVAATQVEITAVSSENLQVPVYVQANQGHSLVEIGPARSATVPTINVPVPAWNDAADSPIRHLDLAGLVRNIVGIQDERHGRSIDLGQLLTGKPLTPAAIDALDSAVLIQDGVKLPAAGGEITANVTYTKEDLKSLGQVISGKEDFTLLRKDWLAAQSRNWKMIFTIPAAFIAVFFVIFLFFGKNPDKTGKKA